MNALTALDGLRVVRLAARAALAAGLAASLGACATIPPGAGSNPADPWERYNRHVSEFNDQVDRAVLRPAAQAYTAVVPEPLRTCFNNAFMNLTEVPNALANTLQGKLARAAQDVGRFAVNSTLGLGGCFDLLTPHGVLRSDEDFGQVLGWWGVAPGPYFVWPFLGPATVRDTVGRVVWFYADPLDYVPDVRLRNSLWGVRFVDLRAALLPAERALEGSIDRYQFIRDAYLQRRQSQIYDGDPPAGATPKYDDPDDEPDAKPGARRPGAPAAPARPAADQPRAQPAR